MRGSGWSPQTALGSWWFDQVQHKGWTSPPYLSPRPQRWLPHTKRNGPFPLLSRLFVCISFFGSCVLLCIIIRSCVFHPLEGKAVFCTLCVFPSVWPWLISWVMKRPTFYQLTLVCGPLIFFLHPQQQIKKSNRQPLQRPPNFRLTKASVD